MIRPGFFMTSRMVPVLLLFHLLLTPLVIHAAELQPQPEVCPVCINPLLNPVTTSCGHTFDYLCLKKWLDKKSDCPGCRASLLASKNPEIFPKPCHLDPERTDLNCNSLPWRKISFKQLATSLLFHKNLTLFKVTAHCFEPTDVKILASMIQTRTSIQHLDISDLSLEPDDLRIIFEAMAINIDLKSIAISGNKLGRLDPSWLAESLISNHGIESIDLSRNKFRFEGAFSFIKLLAENRKSIEIDLRFNDLEEDEIDELKQLIQNRPGLKIHFESQTPAPEQLTHLLENAAKIFNGTLKKGDFDILRFTLRLQQCLQKCTKMLKKNHPDLIKGSEYLKRLKHKVDDYKPT